MSQLKNDNLYSRLKQWIGLNKKEVKVVVEEPKAEIKKVGVTCESASIGVDKQTDLFRSLDKSKNITHGVLVDLSKIFFNVDITGNMFCFRSGGPYGLVLIISSVSMISDTQDNLDDILLELSDYSLNTSMKIKISVKDLEEMFKPFKLQLPVRTST